MSLSLLFLALFVFLLSAPLLEWFTVSSEFLGWFGVITALLLVLEGGWTLYQKFGRRV